MGYGKHFAAMYEGSLYGSGAVVFAVWGYVIACQQPSKDLGSTVILNPKKLADTLGEDEVAIIEAIAFLCAPDARSTTKKEGGRRLVQIGEFEYRVVNGAKYRAIRDEEERRIQNRISQQRLRDRMKKDRILISGPTKNEAVAEPLSKVEGGELDDIAKAAESALGTTEEVLKVYGIKPEETIQ